MLKKAEEMIAVFKAQNEARLDLLIQVGVKALIEIRELREANGKPECKISVLKEKFNLP